jgi:hypothetical protein
VVPPAQVDPVVRFMERLSLYDDEAPGARSHRARLPAAPPDQDTSIVARPIAPVGLQSPAGAHAAEPHTVRTPMATRRVALKQPHRLAMLAIAAGLVTLVGTVFVRCARSGILISQTAGPRRWRSRRGPRPSRRRRRWARGGPTAVEPPPRSVVDPVKVKARRHAHVTVTAPARALARPRAKRSVRATALSIPDHEARSSRTTPSATRKTWSTSPAIDYAALPTEAQRARAALASDVKLGSRSLGPTPPISVVAGTYRVVVVSPKSTVTRTVKVKPNDELLTVDVRTPK